MSITKRGSSFQATVHYKGERYRKSFSTKAEAITWESQTMAALVSGTPPQDLEGSTAASDYQTMTLAGLLELTHARIWKGKSSERTSVLNAQKCVDVLGPHLPPSAVNERKLDHLVFAFELEGISNSTINRRLSALSKMLTVAYERGIILRRPKFERKEEPAFRNRAITAEEENDLLGLFAALGNQDMVDFCVVALDTGGRCSEILKLTSRDIHGDCVLLPGPITKNRKPRLIPLTSRALEVLKRRAGEGDKRFFDEFTYDMARHYWDVARYKLGKVDDPHFVMHVMRHTFCTRLISAGVDVSEVCRLAGHSNVQVTMRYIATSPESLRNAIDKMQAHMMHTNSLQLPKVSTEEYNPTIRHTPQLVA